MKTADGPNIPIQAIGLSLYEKLNKGSQIDSSASPETIGAQVQKTQWLDMSGVAGQDLIGKNILIVDEVDDSRSTLEFACRELQKDVSAAALLAGRSADETTFGIFVLHVCTTTSANFIKQFIDTFLE